MIENPMSGFLIGGIGGFCAVYVMGPYYRMKEKTIGHFLGDGYD
jgi:hypothetical protein